MQSLKRKTKQITWPLICHINSEDVLLVNRMKSVSNIISLSPYFLLMYKEKKYHKYP